MRIARVFCKYHCSMSCNKVERPRLRRMVKEIDFWYGEIVKPIRLDVDAVGNQLLSYDINVPIFGF